MSLGTDLKQSIKANKVFAKRLSFESMLKSLELCDLLLDFGLQLLPGPVAKGTELILDEEVNFLLDDNEILIDLLNYPLFSLPHL